MIGRSAYRISIVPFVLGLTVLLTAGLGPARAAGGTVDLLTATGVVDGVMASYISEGIARAESDGAGAVVIALNTPGGSLAATSQIVSSLLESPVPVIVWVSPAGGRAASAGTFITLAANLALMAPGTNIGAASPVGGQGQEITGTEGEKVRNDAIASIRSIAEARGRNVGWATSTVETAVSSPASEAVAKGAVDGIAGTLDEVLAFATGKVVSVAGGRQVTLDLAGANVVDLDLNPFQQFLHLLSDPNLAFILFTLGFYGLLFELMHPNFMTGILGGISLILGFIGSGSLPLNAGGVLLLGLSVLLLFFEAYTPAHGLLAVAAMICFALGAAAFYTAPGPGLPAAQVSLPVVIAIGALGVAFVFVVVRAAVRIRRMRPAPVSAGLSGSGIGTLGEIAEVRRDLDPVGSIYVAGEEWSARTAGGITVAGGQSVRVVGQDGLTLVVEPLDLGGTQNPAA